MKENRAQSDLSKTALEILAYLTEHPDAQDTIEGIAPMVAPGTTDFCPDQIGQEGRQGTHCIRTCFRNGYGQFKNPGISWTSQKKDQVPGLDKSTQTRGFIRSKIRKDISLQKNSFNIRLMNGSC